MPITSRPSLWRSSDAESREWTQLNEACGVKDGGRQSPIALESENFSNFFLSHDPLHYFNYYYFDSFGPAKYVVRNTGTTVMFTPEGGKIPQLTGNGLSGRYILAQFHFHWGSDASKGSEHTIDGERFPLEMHMVFYNAEFSSLTQAVESRRFDAITMAEKEAEGKAWRKLEEGLRRVKEPGEAQISGFPLRWLIPKYVASGPFFRYDGSLTTPPCSENVRFTVFKTTAPISARTMRRFRKLSNKEGRSLVDNFRNLQPSNGRIIVETSQKYGKGDEDDEDRSENSSSSENLGAAVFNFS
ncbi:unnamed protein product [Darwinula stevensoni]|uniref:Carbonic anhydrase n=1 Tax=Darwinula stevensoni TaxID=69355 RepID=A0A7R9AC11_9CRUS|nr:unnamed protein product [Darwinula stevensoni]CAG0899370.1 unnamed protein product [Darwinula stevensoni]